MFTLVLVVQTLAYAVTPSGSGYARDFSKPPAISTTSVSVGAFETEAQCQVAGSLFRSTNSPAVETIYNGACFATGK